MYLCVLRSREAWLLGSLREAKTWVAGCHNVEAGLIGAACGEERQQLSDFEE